MNIDIATLRSLTELLLRAVEESGIDHVEVSDDFYWEVSSGKRYNPYEQPTELTLGQLTDDWQELLKLITNQKGREPISHDLVLLSTLIRYIGEKTFF
jgi:hypothetical protein